LVIILPWVLAASPVFAASPSFDCAKPAAAPPASGARYTARIPQGEALFWQKGPEAIVQLPGTKEQNCSVALRR
jgi:hypothetical protein